MKVVFVLIFFFFFFSAYTHDIHNLKRRKQFPQDYTIMIHSTNYPLQHGALLYCLWYIDTRWRERKLQPKRWMQSLDWNVTLSGSWQQKEELHGSKKKSCAPQILFSKGVIWHFVCSVHSSAERFRGHQHLWMEFLPCYLPVPRVLDF